MNIQRFWRKETTERTSASDAAKPAEPCGVVTAKPDTHKPMRVIIVNVAVFAALAGSVGTAAYFYAENRHLAKVQDPISEREHILAEISDAFELPTGEVPTLATVTDRGKLSGQEFFARAENGDKVLIYSEARTAILYRPHTGKIVNVSPLGIPSPEPTETIAQPTVAGAEAESLSEGSPAEEAEVTVPEDPAKVALMNGTTKKGLTADVEAEFLAGDVTAYEVLAKENASRPDYGETIVIDITNEQTVRAEALAEALGVPVAGGIPDGETVPDGVDILVIIGADRI